MPLNTIICTMPIIFEWGSSKKGKKVVVGVGGGGGEGERDEEVQVLRSESPYQPIKDWNVYNLGDKNASAL
jgi:hypothetical protein